VGDFAYQQVFIEDRDRIFERISLEYFSDLDLPGRALLILNEAATRRQIWTPGLPWMALEAAERSLYDHIKSSGNTRKSTPVADKLPDDRTKRCQVLFLGFTGSEPFQGIQHYFKETKWLFALDRQLYQRYL